jgi:hypothetical protein
MFDARGKNPLSRPRGDSASDDSQPPRKKASPNTLRNQLPSFSRNPSSHNKHPPPATESLTPLTGEIPTQSPEPQARPGQPLQIPPPTPNGDLPNQQQDAPHQQTPPTQAPHQQTPQLTPAQQHTQTQDPAPHQPLPGFTTAEEREEMRRFATERTQTLARQATARTATNGDELEITPAPENGFYRPEGLLSRWTIDNVKAAQVATITSQPGASLVVHIEGETSHDPNRAPHLAAGLARELKRILPLENPQVVPGIPATPPTRATDAPYAYFVHGLTSSAYVKLTAQGAWRTRSMRFYAHLNGRARQSFLGYIQGMSNLTAPRAMTTVAEFISNAFRTGEMAGAIRTVLAKGQTVDGAGDDIIIGQEEVDEIINKLYVERIDLAKGPNIPQPSVNLYILDTDFNDDEWKLLRKAANKTTYVHDLHGVGRYFSGWTCALCHGVTHPTGMCPYLQIEDDVPMSDPVVQPYTKARQNAGNRRGGSARGANNTTGRGTRGRGGGSYDQR